MAEVITNPFDQIFKKSVECRGDVCELRPSKNEAVQWARKFAEEISVTGSLEGVEIISNTAPDSMEGTCMIHCDLEKPNIKCRVFTSADPTKCTSAILTVVDRSNPKPDPNIAWDGGKMSNMDEFSNVRSFMNRFTPCRVNDSTNKESVENSFGQQTQRGKQAVNVGVGFVTSKNEGTRYGFCHMQSNALNPSSLTLPNMRQPSGLGTLMMATPNPRFGGSLTEQQCRDVLKTHYHMCIEKFKDRDRQDGAMGVGYDTSQCDGLPNRCRKEEVGCEAKSVCLLRKKRDACVGITNWDVPEPATLQQNETSLFGIPDADKFCKAPAAARDQSAGAVPGFSPREKLVADDNITADPLILYTQLPETTGIAKEMTNELINLRFNNCTARCDTQCPTQTDRCTELCESLVLKNTQADNSFDAYDFAAMCLT